MDGCSQAPRRGGQREIAVTLDELAREGARRMIATALGGRGRRVRRAVRGRARRGRQAAGRPQRPRPRAPGDGRVGHGRDPGAARQRQARRRGDRRAPAVQLADPAGLRAAVAEGHRRAADALPARPVDRRLPPGAGAAARRGRRRACRRRRSAGCARTGRPSTSAFRDAVAALSPLRVPVRRRRPRLGAPRRGRPAVPARRDRRARGRRQGAARGRGRLPREHRVVGRRDARPQGAAA